MQTSNVFYTQVNNSPKLVEFNISSDMHGNTIKISHSWVVLHLGVPSSKILHNAHRWPHLRGINIPICNYGMAALISTDIPRLHLVEDTRIGETSGETAA